ncbi:MAG: T9SS type A sorting domain-containing protein [Bacteroidetes bacterium]|nr:T9SS type A sorting domain-containing protein [Bacteroidota bacterium]
MGLQLRAFPYVVLLLSTWLLAASVLSTGAPGGRTGAPGDLTCADGGCHWSNLVNSGNGQVSIEGPAAYQSGIPVELTIRTSRPGAARFGFQITVRDAGGSMTGSWEETEGTKLADGGLAFQYLTHAPLAPRATDTYQWKVKWIPPVAAGGNVIFYAAANTANGDGFPVNDFIYTTSFPLANAGNTAVQDELFPSALTLKQAYPNPTREAFTVSFDLAAAASVALFLYDSVGRISHQSETSLLSAGSQQMRIPTSNLPSGLYSYRLTASGHSKMGTITVVR